MAPQAIAQRKLDKFGADSVCEMILNGKAYKDIAESVGVAVGSVLAWLEANPERSARAREARRIMAAYWDQQAEYEIRNAPDTTEGIAKARELAQHFRWRSAKVDPLGYGDRIDLNHRGTIGLTAIPYDPSALTDDQRETMRDALLTLAAPQQKDE